MKKEKEHSVHSHEHEHEHSHEHSCGCDCCGCGEHEHEHKHSGGALEIVITVIGALLIAVSFLPMFGDTVKDILLMAATVICALPIFIDAIKDLKEREISEEFLLVVAVIAACALGEFFEAATVSVLFRAGELMEEFAGDRSRKSIEALFSIVSDTANLVQPDGTVKKIDADEVTAGAKLAVMPHEVVPVDGTVTEGEGSMDASALTGESMPIAVKPGATILSGMMNGDSIIYFEATAGKSQSSAARIVEMVDEASKKKGKAQRAVAKFAKYYTPTIVGAAVLIAVIPSLITGNWHDWIHRSLILLVASCPCAIVISAPLAFFTTMGAAAKNGMIIKGSRYIEALAKVDTAVFDKTGTLTTGELKVGEIYAAEGHTADEVLAYAAKCEYYSTHPIAKAIVAAAGETDISDCSDFSEVAGGGTSVTVPEGKLLCGGVRLMKNNGVDVSDMPKSPVYVALGGKAVGAVGIDGEVRPEAAETIKKLRKLGVEHSVMLTGDTAEQARKVCSVCDIDDFRSGLLPQDKLSSLEDIKDGSKGVIYVGDGINDAPVLAGADVGAAMGSGADAAIEAADVVFMTSDVAAVPQALRISRQTARIAWQNVVFALAVKLAVMILGLCGYASMWLAVIADSGVALLCVLNSIRILYKK